MYEMHSGSRSSGYHFVRVAMPKHTPLAASRPFCKHQNPSRTNRLTTISKRLMVKYSGAGSSMRYASDSRPGSIRWSRTIVAPRHAHIKSEKTARYAS
jgi:hypothetical protein